MLSPERIETAFAQDLTKEEKALLVAVQHQTAGSIFGAKPTAAAWHTKPAWYIVASNDNMIAPEQEKTMAKQINAATTILPSSHVVMLSHPTHFSQMFRQSTGQTTHQFVLHRRVDRAKELLRAADMRVLDVAMACGFESQQHFARVFRSLCGASPTEYRQEFAHRDQPSATEQSAQLSN